MNRTQLVRALAQHTGLTRGDAEVLLESLIQIIEVSLACGEPVTIQHFGRFEPRLKNRTTKRNPRTGEEIHVPPKISVLFRAAPKLRERINRKHVPK